MNIPVFIKIDQLVLKIGTFNLIREKTKIWPMEFRRKGPSSLTKSTEVG
jgi:hypothetical protein